VRAGAGSPGRRSIAVTFVTLGLAYGVWYAYSVFLVALLREFGWSRSLVAGAFSVFVLVHGVLAPPLGWLADRVGPRPLFLAGGLVLGAALWLDGAVGRPWHLYAAFGVVSMLFIVADARLLLPLFLALGLAIALVDGSQRAFVVDLSPPERKGLSLGAYHGLTAGMRLLSGLLAGALYVGVGPEAAFGLAAGLALAASAGLALLVKPPTRSGSPSA